jgi:hypothetical protein
VAELEQKQVKGATGASTAQATNPWPKQADNIYSSVPVQPASTLRSGLPLLLVFSQEGARFTNNSGLLLLSLVLARVVWAGFRPASSFPQQLRGGWGDS